jgi:hypothetical protein
MIKGNLMNNTKTRRKSSMLQDTLSKIKYFLVLAVLVAMPFTAAFNAKAQGFMPIIDQTDTGANRIVAYWDTRGRDTFIQLTNTSDKKINYHVQVFDIDSIFEECEPCNFDDMLSRFDTHVYDIENIVTNSIPSLDIPSVPRCEGIAAPSYGVMVISVETPQEYALIGTFRIIDEAGYEYRTNAVGTEDDSLYPINSRDMIVNFSSANGNNLSDLVGIVYLDLDDRNVLLHPGVQAQFGNNTDQILIYDQIETFESCGTEIFSCAVGNLNKGIDNALPNSKGQLNRVCGTTILNSNSAGWLDMNFNRFICTAAAGGNDVDFRCPETPHFVGFIGLNNGDGTGSMDSWWEREDN